MISTLSAITATGLGSGLCPKSPGTVGTLAFLLLWGVVTTLFGLPSTTDSILIALALCIVGLITCKLYLKKLQLERSLVGHDPQEVVIDEWAGMSIALIGAHSLHWFEVLAAFVLFRAFDIVKPPPISLLEKLPGEWGIMLDDVAAGVIAALLLYFLYPLLLLS